MSLFSILVGVLAIIVLCLMILFQTARKSTLAVISFILWLLILGGLFKSCSS
jgi:hypothetical protein